MSTKVCTKCKISKPLSGFYKSNQAPDGLMYNCKDCKKAYEYARRKPIHVDISDPVFRETKKICPKCKESKYVLYFSLSSRDALVEV